MTTPSLLSLPLSAPIPGPVFTKRQKEQARQQKQRAKVERRSQRRLEGPDVSPQDELQELCEHAEAQAAMFRVGPRHARSRHRGADRKE